MPHFRYRTKRSLANCEYSFIGKNRQLYLLDYDDYLYDEDLQCITNIKTAKWTGIIEEDTGLNFSFHKRYTEEMLDDSTEIRKQSQQDRQLLLYDSNFNGR